MGLRKILLWSPSYRNGMNSNTSLIGDVFFIFLFEGTYMAKIMIVDNNPTIRLLISILVTQAGHEVVVEASNGLEALGVYFKTNPDLLIVDFQMPIMDGIALINEILKVDPDVKVLMCTGSIDQLQSDLRMKKNVPMVTKPFDNDDFIESVTAVLET